MMKKRIAVLLGTMMLAGAMTGCSSSNAASETTSASTTSAAVSEETGSTAEEGTENADAETPESVTVNTAYGEVEVPYAPERICVVDLSTMDIIDALGLGDKVVCLQWGKHYPDHLEGYYNSETIISLTDSSKNYNKSSDTASTEENTDPYEMYYGIDADLILGTTERITEDLYEVLSQIAPTAAFSTSLESEDGIYAGMRANAEAIASIWGVEEKFDSMITPYDDLYTQLSDALNGKSFVMTSGNTDLNTIQIGEASRSGNSSDSSNTTKAYTGTSKKKENSANMSLFLNELGMTAVTENVSEEASAASVAAAVEGGASQEDAANAAIEAIRAVNPDAVFVFNYEYSNLDEIREAGFDMLKIENLECPVCFFSTELTYSASGLTAVTSTMDQMAESILN